MASLEESVHPQAEKDGHLDSQLTLSRLRKPSTHNELEFWHIDQAKWDQLLAAGSQPTTDKAVKQAVKNAKNTLRNFDAAGRMMETEEGMVAAVACTWCAKDGVTHECMVFKDKEASQMCAYCKRHSKTGCTAQREIKAEIVSQGDSPADSQRVRDLEARVLALEAKFAQHQTALVEVARIVGLVSDAVNRLVTDMEAVYYRLWPLFRRADVTARILWERLPALVGLAPTVNDGEDMVVDE